MIYNLKWRELKRNWGSDRRNWSCVCTLGFVGCFREPTMLRVCLSSSNNPNVPLARSWPPRFFFSYRLHVHGAAAARACQRRAAADKARRVCLFSSALHVHASHPFIHRCRHKSGLARHVARLDMYLHALYSFIQKNTASKRKIRTSFKKKKRCDS